MGFLRMKDVKKVKRWKGHDINKVWERFEDVGYFYHDMKVRLGPFENIKDVWKGEPAYIIGAGIEAENIDLNKLDNCHTIGINHMIESYDKFDWFIFLDNRFLEKTTYDLNNFKGKIFQSNKSGILPDSLDVVRFKPRRKTDNKDLNIENGLYNSNLTGLCALHLALISGASPIYLIGCDVPKDANYNNYHYGDYNGEIKESRKLNKYIGALNYYKWFDKWKDRVINVTENGRNTLFKKIASSEMPYVEIKKKDVRVKITDPTICHVMVMDNIDQMGDISRNVYYNSMGKHITSSIKSPNQPRADIYLLECFINQSQKFVDFKRPHPNAKVISLIHSSSSCMPARCSDKVVTITNAWKSHLKRLGHDSTMIYAGIDIDKYKVLPDYSKPNFGRITRWSKGKVHPLYMSVVNNILTDNKESEYYLISNPPANINIHGRYNIIRDIKINEIERKIDIMSKYCIFADMHNTFVETFSLCLLEAMAAGQACLLHSKSLQPAMVEILGNTGIIAKTPKEFEDKLQILINDMDMRKELGMKARERAKIFTNKKMIENYNNVFKGIL